MYRSSDIKEESISNESQHEVDIKDIKFDLEELHRSIDIKGDLIEPNPLDQEVEMSIPQNFVSKINPKSALFC